MTSPYDPPPPRRVFCNRTLNMRSIQAVGFDMDYTLVHYDVPAWEARAFEHTRLRLQTRGYPVSDLRFDPDLFARGLIVDQRLGNIVKATRFGYITQAAHGSRMLDYEERRRTYSQVWVDLSDKRWVFFNTLFSLSEACLYAQLVDLADAGALPGDPDYAALYELVRESIDAAHLEGELKAEIIAAPDRFVVLDPDLPRALLDLKEAGKKLFLATNSEWQYTAPMMAYLLDRWLPGGNWRALFDLVIVQAGKPAFFDGSAAFEEVLDFAGNVRPVEGPLRHDRVYRRGHAELVEAHLGLDGEQILYVGDHVYADVHVSSHLRRWRTALVLRELEAEVEAEQAFAPRQRDLAAGMADKTRLDQEQAMLRLALQRLDHAATVPPGIEPDAERIRERLRALRAEAEALDLRLAPLAQESGQLAHARWGPLMRAGSDKSRLARQIEGHADVYTSRVSNLLWLTPFGYVRAARGNLPHDALPS